MNKDIKRSLFAINNTFIGKGKDSKGLIEAFCKVTGLSSAASDLNINIEGIKNVWATDLHKIWSHSVGSYSIFDDFCCNMSTGFIYV